MFKQKLQPPPYIQTQNAWQKENYNHVRHLSVPKKRIYPTNDWIFFFKKIPKHQWLNQTRNIANPTLPSKTENNFFYTNVDNPFYHHPESEWQSKANLLIPLSFGWWTYWKSDKTYVWFLRYSILKFSIIYKHVYIDQHTM